MAELCFLYFFQNYFFYFCLFSICCAYAWFLFIISYLTIKVIEKLFVFIIFLANWKEFSVLFWCTVFSSRMLIFSGWSKYLLNCCCRFQRIWLGLFFFCNLFIKCADLNPESALWIFHSTFFFFFFFLLYLYVLLVWVTLIKFLDPAKCWSFLVCWLSFSIVQYCLFWMLFSFRKLQSLRQVEHFFLLKNFCSLVVFIWPFSSTFTFSASMRSWRFGFSSSFTGSASLSVIMLPLFILFAYEMF